MFLGIDSRGLAFKASYADVRHASPSHHLTTPISGIVCIPRAGAAAESDYNFAVSAFLGVEFRGEAVFCAIVNNEPLPINEVVLEKLGWSIARAVIKADGVNFLNAQHLDTA